MIRFSYEVKGHWCFSPDSRMVFDKRCLMSEPESCRICVNNRAPTSAEKFMQEFTPMSGS